MDLVGVIVILAVAAFFLTRGSDTEKVSFDTAVVGEANIQNSVTATGTIEAVTTVTVGTQVSGIVNHLYVDYNSVVKKGQVIAELDKTNLLSQLNSAKAALASAKANVASAQDNVVKVQADLCSAEANIGYQRANFNRYNTLHNKGLISATDYENARLTYQQAEASVAASFSTPELFTIAKDLTNMRVIAYVDEADIGDVKTGERVSFTVDAYPDDTFAGTVTQVRQKATTTNNVVTYEVVISASNAGLKLKPGLTANVTIYTQERPGVLSVPSKALRFTPTKETIGKQYTIQDITNAKNKVWTLEGNVLKAHPVNIGMTDGNHTKILSGIAKGKKVITSLLVSTPNKDNDDNNNESSPFAPGPRKKK